MSTNGTISIKTSKGGKTIYTHWDSYPYCNGKTLKKHYDTEKKVKALIELGDISSLEKSIEKPEGHTFDNRVNGYTVFYERDRGKNHKDVKATSFKDLPIRKEEWNYLFQNVEWFVSEGKGKFVLLTDEIIENNTTK